MSEMSVGDVVRLELKRWMSTKLLTPRNKRLVKKLPFVVFERNQHVGPLGGMLVGTLLGVVGAFGLSWVGTIILVAGVGVAMSVIIGVQTYLDMLHAKIDWWEGWLSFTKGKDFYDNPNDWVTKEEYDEEREQESKW